MLNKSSLVISKVINLIFKHLIKYKFTTKTHQAAMILRKITPLFQAVKVNIYLELGYKILIFFHPFLNRQNTIQ